MGIKKGPAWAQDRCGQVFSPKVKSNPKIEDSRAGRTPGGMTVVSLEVKGARLLPLDFTGQRDPI